MKKPHPGGQAVITATTGPSRVARGDGDAVGASEGSEAGARRSVTEAVEQSGLTQLTGDSPTEALQVALEDVARAGRGRSRADRAALRLEAERAVRATGITGTRTLVAAVFAETTPRDRETDQSAVALSDDEPASEPVDGAALLDETAALIRRHVVLTAAQADSIALWH